MFVFCWKKRVQLQQKLFNTQQIHGLSVQFPSQFLSLENEVLILIRGNVEISRQKIRQRTKQTHETCMKEVKLYNYKPKTVSYFFEIQNGNDW